MYIKTHFSVSKASLKCWFQAVMCISIRRMYLRSRYFLVYSKAIRGVSNTTSVLIIILSQKIIKLQNSTYLSLLYYLVVTLDVYHAMAHVFHVLDQQNRTAYLVQQVPVYMTIVVRVVHLEITMKVCPTNVANVMKDAALAQDLWHLIVCHVQILICI